MYNFYKNRIYISHKAIMVRWFIACKYKIVSNTENMKSSIFPE